MSVLTSSSFCFVIGRNITSRLPHLILSSSQVYPVAVLPLLHPLPPYSRIISCRTIFKMASICAPVACIDTEPAPAPPCRRTPADLTGRPIRGGRRYGTGRVWQPGGGRCATVRRGGVGRPAPNRTNFYLLDPTICVVYSWMIQYWMNYRLKCFLLKSLSALPIKERFAICFSIKVYFRR